jgi:hypothetical protein
LGKRADESVQLPAQASIAAIAHDAGYFLLLSRLAEVGFRALRSEPDDSQRWEMLAGVRGLLHGNGGLSLDDKSIKILGQEHADRLWERPDHPGLDVVDFVKNAESPVLEDGVSIQYEEPGFHKCALNGKK